MSFENRYSALDRLLHRLAFSSPSVQIAVADMEDQLFASDLRAIEVDRPVFVTALPRAGTTLLLEAIESLPDFASHTYRNMPFVLCPMLWNRLSSPFQRAGEARERAHGDGMTVSADSPEAFEEMVWKAFWKGHYQEDRIRPWNEDDTEFFDFLRSHMRKIIALSKSETSATPRYLSKNNLNIARIGLLGKNFPDATIIVPFRDPLQHAASLLRQHMNFLEIHKDDPFARRYMAGIGHYDFGENLRPVNFAQWLDRAKFKDESSIGFWLEYWFETYSHVVQRYDVNLLCYEDFCKNPSAVLERLAAVLQPRDKASLLQVATRIRPPRIHSVTAEAGTDELVAMSKELYERLRNSAASRS